MKINLKKSCKYILWFNIIFLMIINFTCEIFNIDIIVKYLADGFNLILLFFLAVNCKAIFEDKNLKLFNFFVILFYIIILISYVFNYYSIFYFFWGLRYISRMFIIFYSSILLFDNSDKKKFINFLDKFYIYNLFVVLFQYFVLGYSGDAIGGFFKLGESGGNSGLLVLLLMIVILNSYKYFYKKIGSISYLFFLISSIFIAAIAELKIFFILLVFIVAYITVFSKRSLKKIVICLFSIVFLVFGINFMSNLFPQFNNFFSLEKIVSYVSGEDHGYSSSNDISRVRAFEQIDNIFYFNKPVNKLIGFGIGNCTPSSTKIFNSAFYDRFGFLHYNWFLHSYLYLEIGMIGYVVFNLIFVSIIFGIKKFKSDSYNYINQSVLLFCVINFILFIYNSFHLSDNGLFIYMFLAVPFIKNKKGDEDFV